MSSEVSDIFETVEIETVPNEENSNILGAEIILADGENIVSVDVADENEFSTNENNEGNYILMLPVHEGIEGLRILQATHLINDLSDEQTSTDVNIDDGTKLDGAVKAFKVSCFHEGCDKQFLSTSRLKVHMRKHNGCEGGYTCDYCKKNFATGYALKAHRRTHTGEKPYTCPESSCQKRFKTSGDLQKHIRTHTGERPFKCSVCLKAFTTSNIRKVHMRVHTGEKPYQCTHDGCERRFSSATNFRNHLRIHTGEKPYICTVQNCQKRFTEYSSLYKHCTVHSEKKKFQCSFCNRQYRQLSTLNIHISTVHKNEVNLYQKNEDCESSEVNATYFKAINSPVNSNVVSQHLVLHPKNGVIPKVNFKEKSFKEKVSTGKEISDDDFSIELPLKIDNLSATGKFKENETLLMSLNDQDSLYTLEISPPTEMKTSKPTKDILAGYRKPSAASQTSNFEPMKAITCGSEAILVLSVPPNDSSDECFEVDVRQSLEESKKIK